MVKNAKNKKMPNAHVLDGIPARNPHEDFIAQDALFKRERGGNL